MRNIPLILFLFISCLCQTLHAAPISSAENTFEKAAFSLLPRKALNTSLLGLNSFVNDPRFGSISAQFLESKNVLRLKNVRVLFAWNDQVQPSPGSQPFFGFYDEIIAKIPSGVNAMVIMTGLPSWMNNSDNWIDGNPRKTFVELWVKPIITRYAAKRRIKAWQIWNEPNMLANQDNQTLVIAENPENYVEMLALAYNLSREKTPRKKIVSAATTAINQNYPESLDYNQAMLDAGAENFLDVWGVHIYGMHLENFFRPTNVTDYLLALQKPIWITESGAQGTTKQLEYAQRMWPFLFNLVPTIKRLYIYQFTDATAADSSYGLRTLTAGQKLSDLYLYLKSKAAAFKKARK